MDETLRELERRVDATPDNPVLNLQYIDACRRAGPRQEHYATWKALDNLPLNEDIVRKFHEVHCRAVAIISFDPDFLSSNMRLHVHGQEGTTTREIIEVLHMIGDNLYLNVARNDVYLTRYQDPRGEELREGFLTVLIG